MISVNKGFLLANDTIFKIKITDDTFNKIRNVAKNCNKDDFLPHIFDVLISQGSFR